MKFLKIFVIFLALTVLLSVSVYAESDNFGAGKDRFDAETNGDGIEEIEPPEDTGAVEEEPTQAPKKNGYKTALTVIFVSLGVIALSGTAAAVYVRLKSKNKDNKE